MSSPPQDPSRRVAQINALVRSLVEQETLEHPFWTSGVVTRCYTSHLGHVYFDVTDDDYTISCMLREKLRGTLGFDIQNTLEIEVFGTIRVYEKTAKVQIEVEKARLIERPGYVMDATVQEQLAQKGLWPKPKRPLPPTIARIGLITSKHSDALHDFEDIYRSENGTAAIKLMDVRLQGQQAPQEIAEAVSRLNRERQVDVIAIVRGGGRSTELAVFNDIQIAEAIGRSVLPVVTGIGHQRDDTLADQMADHAAITPSIAASYLARHSQPKPVESKPPQPNWSMYWVLGGVSLILLIVVIVLLVSR